MDPVTAAGLITLAIQEAPAIGALIARLVNAGRTEATADELAALEVSDADLAAAYARAFPGAKVGDTSPGLFPPPTNSALTP